MWTEPLSCEERGEVPTLPERSIMPRKIVRLAGFFRMFRLFSRILKSILR